jgi:hypothetical protein
MKDYLFYDHILGYSGRLRGSEGRKTEKEGKERRRDVPFLSPLLLDTVGLGR